MIYKMVLQDRNGNLIDHFYNPHTNVIQNQFGSLLVRKERTIPLKPFHKVSAETPGKKGVISTLKIQLGLKCNYSCSYCLQSSEIADQNITSNTDTHDFIDNISKWLSKPPKKIEFWGGEPFVYWSKLKILVPELRNMFPKAEFLIITNGSLLDEEKIKFICDYDILIGMSHDGPQQKFRGPDPFRDEKQYEIIKSLVAQRPGKVSFNIVIHSKNYDLNAIYDWFNERFPNPNLTLEGIVSTYDDYTLKSIGQFTKAQYNELVNNIFYELTVHRNRFKSLSMKLESFIESLRQQFPIEMLHQRCGMDKEDMIAVDLQGNVMTCQNTGSKGHHKIGSVYDYENIKLNTSTHLSFREECMHCPVVQLCKGGCMYLEKDYFAQSCWNEYYYNLGVFKAALFMMTGRLLIRMDGDIRRPSYSDSVLEKNPQLKELYQ